MDDGSGTTGYIWTIYRGMTFFFGIIAKLTHIFFSMSTLIFFLFLPIVNFLKITKTLIQS